MVLSKFLVFSSPGAVGIAGLRRVGK